MLVSRIPLMAVASLKPPQADLIGSVVWHPSEIVRIQRWQDGEYLFIATLTVRRSNLEVPFKNRLMSGLVLGLDLGLADVSPR